MCAGPGSESLARCEKKGGVSGGGVAHRARIGWGLILPSHDDPTMPLASRRWRFRLRTLMVGVAVVGLLGGMAGVLWRRHERLRAMAYFHDARTEQRFWAGTTLLVTPRIISGLHLELLTASGELI